MEPWHLDLIKLIAAHQHDRPLQVYTLANEVIDAVAAIAEARHQDAYRRGYQAGHAAASSRQVK